MGLTFDQIVDYVVGPSIEGGYVNNPRDPGGATNHGITQKRLDLARAQHSDWGLPGPVDLLTTAQAIRIYRAYEWAEIHGDDLPGPIALLAFDAAVNQGSPRAIDELQSAAKVNRDGVMGSVTLRSIAAHPLPDLVDEYAAQRMFYYMKLDALQDTFGLGWSRRLMKTHALAMRSL